MARALRIHAFGGPEAISLDEVSVGNPGPGQALVRHAAVGVNFVDLHQRAGRYPIPSFPATLGMEGAGVVEAVGAGVGTVKPGDRVCYSVGGPGAMPCTYADYAIRPADDLIRVPDEIDDITAAGMTLKGLTAQYLLRAAFPVEAGETIMVHAAAGGVGLLLCQWAAYLGARVIGVVGTESKAALAAEFGCHHVIVADREDIADRARALTGGEGVSVVYDSVGKDTYQASLEALRVRGMLVSFGSASGAIPPFNLFDLNSMGSLYVTSAGLAWYTRSRPELLERAGELIDLVCRGVLRVPVLQQWPLAEAAEAHRALEARATTGMSVLLP